MENLADAISRNISLEFLDAFDIDFSNSAAKSLDQAVRKNASLKSIRLANSRVSADVAESLL